MPSDDEELRPQDLLGLDHSDPEDAGSGSDDEGRAANIHRTKRRRVQPTREDESDAPSDDDEEEEATVDPRFAGKLGDAKFAQTTGENDNQDDDEEKPEEELTITNPSKLKALTQAELLASKAATAKTGVVYLSRIPPFMKPQKVRDLLARFGKIGRVFLAPEDPKAHSKRVKFGGNKKRDFVEGWIEFLNKREAKLAAETLNTNTVGGKKGSYYYDDVWNIKYLPKFKWHHLQAQIAYENASRQAKFRTEIAHETRINKTYLRNVERAKMVEKMQETKLAKRKAEGGGDDEPPAQQIVRRQFRQHKVRGTAADKVDGREKSEKVKNLLSKVF